MTAPRFKNGQRVQITKTITTGEESNFSAAHVGGYGHVIAHIEDMPPGRWGASQLLDHLIELHPSSPGAELHPDEYPRLWFAGCELAAID